MHNKEKLRLIDKIQEYGMRWPCKGADFMVHETLWYELVAFMNRVMRALGPKRTGRQEPSGEQLALAALGEESPEDIYYTNCA